MRSQVVVPPEGSGRADRFLAGALPHLSRARIQELMEQGHILLDGRPARPSQTVKPGQQWTVDEPAPVSVELKAQDIPLHILFEDAHMLVLNKAPGMVVHPAAGNPDGTMVNALLHHAPDLPAISGEIRPGIVHRLDKDTSGVMVVAKGEAALRALQAEFKDRRAEKTYLALALGTFAPAAGVLRTPYGRDPRHRKKFTARQGKREAVTEYRVLAASSGVSLVELILHTGRTHQIRVHLSELGHPLLGDELYGARRAQKLAPRQMLHAARLLLHHPQSQKPMTFQAPVPEDMCDKVRELGLWSALEAWLVHGREAGSLRKSTSGRPPAGQGPR